MDTSTLSVTVILAPVTDVATMNSLVANPFPMPTSFVRTSSVPIVSLYRAQIPPFVYKLLRRKTHTLPFTPLVGA